MSIRSLKIGIFSVLCVYLTLGYVANQIAYFQGIESLATYISMVQSPMIIFTSLVLLLLAIAYAFVPDGASEK